MHVAPTEYLARVRELTDDERHHRAAEALAALARNDGPVQGDPVRIVREAVDDPFYGLRDFGRFASTHGLIARRYVHGMGSNVLCLTLPREDAVSCPPVVTQDAPDPSPRVETPAPAGPAVTVNVPTREPKDQNEHTVALLNSQDVTANVFASAIAASLEIGIRAGTTRTRFARVERELTPEYLSGKTGLSITKTKTAMKEAVQLGYFVRTDNGKGGRGHTNRATYRATLPA